ncbi:unnamed protein product [Sphenostylis stenocarpa]|uniref:Uncharacterized protein n=1 Tax=Sphenostylis stenocarpa TaxID=92480 RepID=A0AA86RLI7_9FABA|nr:unnamed protein product [Sphenostylis stenocarpa]
MKLLEELDLSNNQLSVEISEDIFEAAHQLRFLKLSNNKLEGPIFLIPTDLQILFLNDNKFNGRVPSHIFNTSIISLDVTNNRLVGKIPSLIKNFSRLSELRMSNNHFEGSIPLELAQHEALKVLDLSQNNLTGKTKEKASFTSKKRDDTYIGSILAYMSGIDLSQNKLKGNIPYELGNLTRIRGLNLSHNELTGQIPDSFSKLIQTESLDLSFNMLSGQIPPQLNILTSLAVFSVAHNNLSGPTPERTRQFSTFDESSYEDNPFLCGPPLPKSCNPASTVIPTDSNTDREDGSLVDMYVFCVSFVVAYTLALLATAAALYINPYWRQAWFYYMELLTLNCYYFMVDNLRRFSNSRNM